MMAFTMRGCASIPDTVRRLLVVLALFACTHAAADDSQITLAEIVPGEGGYVLNADIELDLNSRLTDAITRGVAIHFVAELTIERPRWYWMNEVVVERELNYRVSYHAITRSYRLSIGSLHQSFESLDTVLLTMQRIRNWQIAGPDELTPGISHEVSLRFRLDTAQLPKPFQVTAIGSRDWNVGTDWLRWTFLPGAANYR